MPVWRSTTYADQAEGSPEPGFVLNAGRAHRTIKVAWDAIVVAVQDFVGWAEVRTDPSPGGPNRRFIHRRTPHPFPPAFNAKGERWLWCTGAPRVKGVGPRGTDGVGLQSYEFAFIDLTYSSLTYDIVEDSETIATDGPLIGLPDEGLLRRYVTRLGRFGGKLITMPFGFMRLMLPTVGNAEEDAKRRQVIREGLPYRLPESDLRYIHHSRPDYPAKTVQRAFNTVNADAFDGFPPETLLLEGADNKPERSPLGDRTWTFEFQMKFRPNMSPISENTGLRPPHELRGWNHILRRLTPEMSEFLYGTDEHQGKLDFVPISSDGSPAGTRMYQTSSFRKLFQPDQEEDL